MASTARRQCSRPKALSASFLRDSAVANGISVLDHCWRSRRFLWIAASLAFLGCKTDLGTQGWKCELSPVRVDAREYHPNLPTPIVRWTFDRADTDVSG